mmetsp:Transcript_59431/g.191235  ORF Transcript_59431/g.191235 Transcript_59431/m.191235 type:complete len:237 (+) Transcript_59431:790-1500(+)
MICRRCNASSLTSGCAALGPKMARAHASTRHMFPCMRVPSLAHAPASTSSVPRTSVSARCRELAAALILRLSPMVTRAIWLCGFVLSGAHASRGFARAASKESSSACCTSTLYVSSRAFAGVTLPSRDPRPIRGSDLSGSRAFVGPASDWAACSSAASRKRFSGRTVTGASRPSSCTRQRRPLSPAPPARAVQASAFTWPSRPSHSGWPLPQTTTAAPRASCGGAGAGAGAEAGSS